MPLIFQYIYPRNEGPVEKGNNQLPLCYQPFKHKKNYLKMRSDCAPIKLSYLYSFVSFQPEIDIGGEILQYKNIYQNMINVLCLD